MTRGPTGSKLQECSLPKRAQAGEEDAFAQLVEEQRPGLLAHCYRMLGSVDDAEDALQEAFLRGWRGLPKFEGRSSLRSWLYRIATNACLDALARRPKRLLPLDYGLPGDPRADLGRAVAESVWVEPYPDERLGLADGFAAPAARYEQCEAVELAFIAALQHLPARQRAALILRDVLGFSAQEVAEALETTVASVKSALQRARKAIDERLPEQSQQMTLRTIGDKAVREIVQRYIRAWESDDIDALVAMLTDDATIAMRPTPSWYRGREAIAAFYARGPLSGALRWRHVPTRANSQLAVACYAWDVEAETHTACVLDVLTLRGRRLAEITAFLNTAVFRSFGLPTSFSPSDQRP